MKITGARAATSTRTSARLVRALLLAALASAASLVLASAASAASFTVDSLADEPDAFTIDGACRTADGECTLRAAIQSANANDQDDTIDFAVGGQVNLLSALPTLEDDSLEDDAAVVDDLTIAGRGRNALTVRRSDSAAEFRIFEVAEDADVAISGLTVANGVALQGGGIYSGLGANLTLEGVRVSGNLARAPIGASVQQSARGGGISHQGPRLDDDPAERGQLTITGAEVSENSVTGINGFAGGGGISTYPGSARVSLTRVEVSANEVQGAFDRPARGGGIEAGFGRHTLDRTTVSDNQLSGASDYPDSSLAFAGVEGGGIFYAGTLTFTNGTVSGNHVADDGVNRPVGGGLAAFDVGPNQTSAPPVATIENSTISGNTVIGFFNTIFGGSENPGYGGGINSRGALALRSVTLADNGSTFGGGGENLNVEDGSVTVQNTIVADPRNGNANCSGEIVSEGHNIADDGGCRFVQPTDRSSTDPQLGELADNGGPTETHAIPPSSSALDSGDNAAGGFAFDQRGEGFDRTEDFPAEPNNPQAVGDGTDVGAFELQGAPAPECSDEQDNDGDERVDLEDPGCTTADDNAEDDAAPPPPEPTECVDGQDNDGDGKVDFGPGRDNDPGCTGQADEDESSDEPATFRVTNTQDAGEGSLRQAILGSNASPGDDTILIDTTGTVPLGELGLPTVADDVSIEGPGMDAFTVRRAGNANYRIFTVGGVEPPEVSISGLTVANGSAPLGQGGGGISSGGDLTLSEVRVSDNRTTATFAGDQDFGLTGGGILAAGGLTLERSVVEDNRVVISSSGTGEVGARGGGIAYQGLLTVNESTVRDNSVTAEGASSLATGGGIADASPAATTAEATIETSTVSGNEASASSTGASTARGGGIDARGPTSVDNSTVSANTVGATDATGGGIHAGGTLALTSATIADNGATSVVSPSTAANIAVADGAVASARSTIVADPRGGLPNCTPSGGGGSGLVFSLGHSLDGGSSCNFSQPTDQGNTDPHLGPLADNGGPTMTHALPHASAALDRGDNAAGGFANDQRGQGFPRTIDFPNKPNGSGAGGADVGAFELQPASEGPTGDASCSDGFDNDADGDLDGADGACAASGGGGSGDTGGGPSGNGGGTGDTGGSGGTGGGPGGSEGGPGSGGGTGGGGGSGRGGGQLGTGGEGDAADKVRPALVVRITSARQGRRRARGRVIVRVSGRLVNRQGRPCRGRVAVGTRMGGRRGRRVLSLRGRCQFKRVFRYRVGKLRRRVRPRGRRLLVRVNASYKGSDQLRPDRAPSVLRRVIR